MWGKAVGRLRASALVVGFWSLALCASAQPIAIGSDFRIQSEHPTVLVMEPDVTVTFLTTGGPEQRADWSQQAETNLTSALMTQLSGVGVQAASYNAAAPESIDTQQAVLLNQAVTNALAAHVAFIDPGSFMGNLPHQKIQPETYTLAETAQQLSPGSTADYAMFLTSHARIESGGVFWTSVMIGAVTGYVPVSTAFRGTYLSLVDMHTGNVVWLKARVMGDPRNPTEAAAIISEILRGGPFQGSIQASANAPQNAR
jgi:hypothetical protein